MFGVKMPLKRRLRSELPGADGTPGICASTDLADKEGRTPLWVARQKALDATVRRAGESRTVEPTVLSVRHKKIRTRLTPPLLCLTFIAVICAYAFFCDLCMSAEIQTRLTPRFCALRLFMWFVPCA
jgi:hypothetical protein